MKTKVGARLRNMGYTAAFNAREYFIVLHIDVLRSPSTSRASTITIWLLNVGPLSLALSLEMLLQKGTRLGLSAFRTPTSSSSVSVRGNMRVVTLRSSSSASRLRSLRLYFRPLIFSTPLAAARENLCIRRKEAPVVHTEKSTPGSQQTSQPASLWLKGLLV